MFRPATLFDKYLEKATSELNLDPDWDSIIACCDSIRSGETTSKYAVGQIKKRMYSSNPHVCLFALQLLESCVKNCGSQFHIEMVSRPFMEELRDLAKIGNEKLKNKILELIQVWAHAFRNDPHGRIVAEAMNYMKNEGFKFPVLKESDAMFAANVAPEWATGDRCHRCRTTFGMLVRKHHCRCCGQIFCDKCSSKSSPIPKFGIEREVRVCEECYDKLNKAPSVKIPEVSGATASAKALKTLGGTSSSTSSPKASDTKGDAKPQGKSEQELKEEEELQLALAISMSEATAQSQHRGAAGGYTTRSSGSGSFSDNNKKSKKEKSGSGRSGRSESDPMALEDPDLKKYLDREYWEKKQQQQKSYPAPTAPHPDTPSVSSKEDEGSITSAGPFAGITLLKEPTGSNPEMEQFVSELKKMLEIFVNRMNSNKVRGRPIANDSSVQSLFINITQQHSQLIKYMQQEEDSRANLERLQDKLNEIRDGRLALDSLKEEETLRRKREAEELEVLRQQQMAHKLGLMRQKKQEFLEYQRQVALQRIQDQEREMNLRKEQNKYMASPGQGVGAPQMHQQAPPPQQQWYNPQGQYGPPVYGPPQGVPYGMMPAPHMGPNGYPMQYPDPNQPYPGQGPPQQQMGHPAPQQQQQQQPQYPPTNGHHPQMPPMNGHGMYGQPPPPQYGQYPGQMHPQAQQQPPPPPPGAPHMQQQQQPQPPQQQVQSTVASPPVESKIEVPEAPLISFD